MATLEQIEQALRAADAAGNVDDARRLAQAYADMRTSTTAAPEADFSDVTSTSSTTSKPPKQRTTAQKLVREVGGLGLRNVVEGAADLAGIVTDPLLAGWNALTGDNQVPTRQAWGNALTSLGVPQPETSGERVAGDIGRALTGTALTMGAGTLLQGGRAAAANPTAVNRLGDLLTAQPNWQVASTITGAGAAGATREAGGGAGAQALAGLAGGMGPQMLAGAGAATLRAAVRGRDGSQMARTIGDFNALGANPSAGQASGNRMVQGVENLLAGAPTSTGVMTRFAERQADDIGEGLQTAAERLSPRASAERAGRAVEKGTETFANNTKAMKKALYWQADQFIPGATPMPLTRTQRALQELTTPVTGAEATTGSLIKPRMQQMADDVKADIAAAQAAGGTGIPYEAVKKIRSEIGEQLSDFSLSVDRPTAELKRLYAALSQDLEEAARAAGPQAERAARRANNYTRAVADRLEQVQRVIDKNGGPEQVFNSAMSGTRDGGTTLRAVMQSLPKEGQQALTAAVIKRMGLATPGAQDAAGDVFSSGTFMTNWSKLSPEAKRSLFDRYRKGFSENMDRIARVASNIKEGTKVYANPAGTANRGVAFAYATALAASLLDPTFVSTGGLLAGGLSANLGARLLTNPTAVEWLAKATAMPKGSAVSQLQLLARMGEARGDEDATQIARELREALPNENDNEGQR
ncbi:hypothetical protein [Lysobacter antibioticus]|uniref:Uncharacterized protein n=1 Tax=Lysobacter antibioticus TaxID=84531 RepID=A0A0S2F7I1_LYSAN|nr:hypothetical protein [Lysobacter antibioticus]ALN79511.1 hypothetical protein LA76x_1354 [Lysobacter antibioticus]